MATRNIKDAKDLSTNELIYFKGHAKATYMSDGRTVEEAVNGVEDELSQKQDEITPTNKLAYSLISDTPSLAEVATSGSYNDLSNKPTIPSAVTESTVSNWGFTKNTGTVTKVRLNSSDKTPSYGIVNLGAIATSIKVNNVAKTPSTQGEVNLGYVTTSIKVDNVAKTLSSTPGEIDLGYVNKQLSTSTSSSMTLSPNIYYRNTSTSLSTLTITLGSVSNSNIINEYFVEFTTSSSGTTISLPSTIKWVNGETPTFEASTTYQISIVNNLGVVTKFK